MFIHLHVHTPYSFLDGASSIDQYMAQAIHWEMPAIAVTDHNSLSNAVEFHQKAQAAGIKPIQGVEVTTEEGGHLTILAENTRGYQNLCRILSQGFASDRQHPRVSWEALNRYHDNVIVLTGCRHSPICQALLRNDEESAVNVLQRLIEIFGKHQVYLEMINTFLPKTAKLLEGLFHLHQHSKTPIVATNNTHYADKQAFAIHDLLVCTRTLTTLSDIHPERPLNQENYLASPAEMAKRFPKYPAALHATLEIAERCQNSLPLGLKMFPSFTTHLQSSQEMLEQLAWEGASKRYGHLTSPIQERLTHELTIIAKLGVADYFLAMWDIVEFARRQSIRYAGRGSAADSAVAYCLEITNVDAIGRGLLFERFLSLERAEKPDIDVDFDARHRDRIAEYVYQKYGVGHVASVCTFATYRARSALRDFGKAFGYSQEELGEITRGVPHHVPADGIRHSLEQLPELRNHPLHARKYQPLIDYCAAVIGFPRHIGTHLGGLVISGPLLTEVTPLRPSAKGVLITEFDKTTIEELGLIKLDLLSLRTLSAVADVDQYLVTKETSYDSIPLDDPSTYHMLNSGKSVGVFQLESPAQRSLQSRLGADNIEDIVASVALIRPGPIKGDMVEPFISRRHGLEQPSYIHPKLEPILAKTYGVVLYQEQVIEIATEIAGFTPGESDRLRRTMTKYRSQTEMEAIGEEFVRKSLKNGIEQDVAETIFSYILGYAGYGFCEAHAAAFADTAYKTAFLLRHHPAHFYAALLNHQPMGFYPAHTLIVEARGRGIAILPLDILASEYTCVATEHSIRIGFLQVRGMEKQFADRILSTREEQPFQSLADFIYRTNPDRDTIENLIVAGAFDRFSANRRNLLWQSRKYSKQKQGALFVEEGNNYDFPDFTAWQRYLNEYRVLGTSATGHIMDFYRPDLQRKGVITSEQVANCKEGPVRVAGVVIRPHRPPTRSGKTVVFLTLEDERGLVDVTIFEDTYIRYAKVLYSHGLLQIHGQLTSRGAGSGIVAHEIIPLPLPPNA